MDLTGPLPLQAHYLWFVGGLFLIVGEVLTGGFILLWFAIGAFAAGLCAFLGAPFNLQLVAFGVSSLLLFMASRTIFRTVLMRHGRKVATNVEAMIGTHAEVLEEIGPGLRAGTVKIGGETWNAISTVS